ncbi:hypothetical protein RCF27_10240 [Rhodococcus pyridinivorans]|uniref:Uncharacterized protein n=1 Tax=Rhodococcus pyridinivorans TaxID=103816 RepID=A0A7M2XS68_9NOCA|nr:hypothetical protein [Rhodococcus pyridinivorans]QOW00620.1 hypothetical protein INP59_10045 [Rhodococcus pyridinivorans]WMM74624.1 hypothetical protein RCF27_10240 [Rhodococcus pyridinivorans]
MTTAAKESDMSTIDDTDTVAATIDPTTAEQSPTASEAATEPAPEPNTNAEAAKYRKQLRAAEKDRDAALAQLETMRRDVIDDLIEREHKIKPAAFWANGNTVDAMLDEDGRIDRAAVAAAVDDAVRTLGLHPPAGVYVPSEGNTPDLSSFTTWADMLNPHSRR